MCRFVFISGGFFLIASFLPLSGIAAPPAPAPNKPQAQKLPSQKPQSQKPPIAKPIRSPGKSFYASIDERGSDAYRLQFAPYNLLGRNIAIGQVEPGRPAQIGLDKKVGPGLRLAGVFQGEGPAKSKTDLDEHAHNVASIMVGRNKTVRGVAPEARLYSGAIGDPRVIGQPEECLTMAHIAAQNGGDIRAINLSFGESLRRDSRPKPILDGNALLTQCLDWSARVHNVVYAVAGNQGKGGIPIPTDTFNGLTVAFSTQVQGVFRRIDFANLSGVLSGFIDRFEGKEYNLNQRSSVHLVAPGSQLSLLNPDGTIGRGSGTSFAAPQVTASVALLQEYVDRQAQDPQVLARQPAWANYHGRQQEVMRAVLLNAADKLQDSGDGNRLGMTKTILIKDRQDWLSSIAFADRQIPLDPIVGAGQLNAFRAYEQLSSGEQPPGQVSLRGWNYGQFRNATPTPSGPEISQDYSLDRPLRGGSYIAATLVWNRQVDLDDSNKNDRYDLGETFRDRGLNNLDLYLMNADEPDSQRQVSASVSRVDNLEHIFIAIPETGRYKLRVVLKDNPVNLDQQPYAIAWWGVGP
jgi:hypothetical protein